MGVLEYSCRESLGCPVTPVTLGIRCFGPYLCMGLKRILTITTVDCGHPTNTTRSVTRFENGRSVEMFLNNVEYLHTYICTL